MPGLHDQTKREQDRRPCPNPSKGSAVLKVQVKDRQDSVTVVGNTTSVTSGERLEATGPWVVDREHGQQFKADGRP